MAGRIWRILHWRFSDRYDLSLYQEAGSSSPETRLSSGVPCFPEEASHRIRSTLRVGMSFERPSGAHASWFGRIPKVPSAAGGLHPGLLSFRPSGTISLRMDQKLAHTFLNRSNTKNSVLQRPTILPIRLGFHLITPRLLRSMKLTSRATSSPAASSPISARIFSRACVVFSLAASSSR